MFGDLCLAFTTPNVVQSANFADTSIGRLVDQCIHKFYPMTVIHYTLGSSDTCMDLFFYNIYDKLKISWSRI